MTNDQITYNLRNRLGIERLNDMQEAVSASASREIILLSPTGSGKTVAFAIPLLRSLTTADGTVQAVVIAPARELVLQISRVIRELATGYKTVAFYGGHSMTDETRSLQTVPDIVVATPGRLLDHIRRGQLSVETARTLVLDEYDKALDLGFQDEMRRIVRRIGHRSLTILTSATPISELPDFLAMKRPQVIDFSTAEGGTGTQAPRIDTVEVSSPVRDKLDTAVDLLHSLPDGRVILFVNHRESADRVYHRLRSAGLPAGLYHGGLEQYDRETAIDLLNNGTTPILVATDLGARGLDIEALSAVIHYHIPPTQESWTHRNGRTARMGATGTVYVITAEGENIPDYMRFDRSYAPTGNNPDPIRAHTATLHINAGRREKISRGDIVGFLIANGGLDAGEIGRIVVRDHNSIVAVPAGKLTAILSAVAPHRLKNRRVRITPIR